MSAPPTPVASLLRQAEYKACINHSHHAVCVAPLQPDKFHFYASQDAARGAKEPTGLGPMGLGLMGLGPGEASAKGREEAGPGGPARLFLPAAAALTAFTGLAAFTAAIGVSISRPAAGVAAPAIAARSIAARAIAALGARDVAAGPAALAWRGRGRQVADRLVGQGRVGGIRGRRACSRPYGVLGVREHRDHVRLLVAGADSGAKSVSMISPFLGSSASGAPAASRQTIAAGMSGTAALNCPLIMPPPK